MKSSTVVALIVTAAAVGVAAWLVDRNTKTAEAPGTGAAPALFPALADHVNDVALIGVKHGKAEFTVKRQGTSWEVVEKGGFPARMETVKGAVVGLAQLRPVEAKTTRPELYSKIGVEDPDPAQKEDAAQGPDESFVPTALTFKDEKGTVLASAILGKVKGGETPEVYVRKTGDPQSWLAEGSVEAPPEPLGWIDRQVANIPRDRIKEVTISRPDGETVIVSREKPEDRTFTVRNVPAGRELSSPSAGEPLGAALSFLAIDDVLPADQLDFAGAGVARASICTFRTFDGLLVTAETATKDGKTWLRLEATYEAPADPTEPPKADAPGPTPAETPKAPTIKPAEYVKKEADELNTKARPWVFQVPDYKAKVFATKMEELLKPLSPAPQGAVPPPAGPELPKPPGG